MNKKYDKSLDEQSKSMIEYLDETKVWRLDDQDARSLDELEVWNL